MEGTLNKLNVKDKGSTKLSFTLFYFFVFFAIGALSPMLSVYLKNEIGLTGSQIGVIMSIMPIVMIVAQPMWGMVTDYTQRPIIIIIMTILATAIIGMTFPFTNSFVILIMIAGLLAFFQSAIVPISDSLALSYVQRVKGDYGALRLWGAVGFALAVLFVGWLAERVGLVVIFYTFSLALFLTGIISWKLPSERQTVQVNIKEGVKTLFKIPKFILFLFTTFLVFGPIIANNVYFGILITDLGGTLTGVGIAFLLAAGSEAPFMKVASNWIQRMGMLQILMLSAIISGLRWILYYFEPSLPLVYATTIAQGLSAGLFIPAALQYVRDITPNTMRATAISLYAAIGNGLGSWFCTFLGGIILEAYGTRHIYLFFSLLTAIGIFLLFIIKRLDKQ